MLFVFRCPSGIYSRVVCREKTPVQRMYNYDLPPWFAAFLFRAVPISMYCNNRPVIKVYKMYSFIFFFFLILFSL